MDTKGLVVNFLGDSITDGYCVKDIANNRYDNVLKQLCGLKEVRNYGVCATRIAHQHRASANAGDDYNFCIRTEFMSSEADMVIVFGGTNDYCHGDAPFGKIEDVDRNTFCGSVRCLMDMLVRRYPDAKLIFLTPARRLGDEFPSKSRSAGFPLKCYADAIKEVAKDYPVAVFDTYERLGINPNIDSDRLMYTSDGLHLNDVGHRVLAERLCAFLDAL